MKAYVRTQAKKFLRWFRHPRVTFSLIVILLTLYVLGLFIPQKWSFDTRGEYERWIASRPVLGPVLDNLGFTDIYTSPVTLGFLGLFYLNLLLVVSGRIPLVLDKALGRRKNETDFTVEDLQRSGTCREIVLATGASPQTSDRVHAFFRKRAWAVRQSEDGTKTTAVRNRLSAFGFLIFHLSFLLCLTGGLTIYYTRFSGRIALTEGEAFEGDLRQFYAIERQPKVLREMTSLSFRLDKAVFEYEGRQPSRLEAVMSVRFENRETVKHIGVNQPVELGSYTILPVNVGVSPLFVVRDARSGAELDGAWVRLDAAEDREDLFRFDVMDGIDLYVRFYADHVVENSVDRTRTLNIRNPAFRISARQKDRILTERTLKKGERMVVGPHTLEFRSLRRWVDFQVVREQGAGPLVLGFALAIIGLIMRLIFFRKEIRIVQDGERLWIAGTSEYYQYSFGEELDGIAEALQRSVPEAGRGEVVPR